MENQDWPTWKELAFDLRVAFNFYGLIALVVMLYVLVEYLTHRA